MVQRFVSLSLLFLTVIAAGCVGGGGGGEVQNQGDKAISVTEISVTPSQIVEGSNVRVRMGLKNVGQLPAKLLVGDGEGENYGSQILTNHCPDIFDVQSFSASSSNVSDTENYYHLAPDYEVQLNWNLKQSTDNVPLNGYDCPLRFEAPFNYSVEAFKQIQIKENDDVEGSDELFSKSSQGPMKIEIETIGSSSSRGAPTFLEGDSAEVLVRLENKRPEESSYTGTVKLSPPSITARGVQFEEVDTSSISSELARGIARGRSGLTPSDIESAGMERVCPDPKDLPANGNLQLYEDNSKIFRCGLNWTLNTPSTRAEIFASSNYTYVKNVGTRNVQVQYRGE